MKRTLFNLLAIFSLIFWLSLSVVGQLTTTSAVVSDSSSTAWANGTFTITYVNSTPGSPSISGTSVCTLMSVSCTGQLQVVGTLDPSGAFSVSLGDTSLINPAGATWQFTVCPATSSPKCGTTSVAVHGASQSVSTQITAAISPPKVTGALIPTAYNDAEVSATPAVMYFRLSDGTFRCWNSIAWAGCGGGGAGSVTSVGLLVNGASSSGALAITGSPVTSAANLNLVFTGVNGDVMTFGASNAPTDSGILLSALAPLASPTFTGTVTVSGSAAGFFGIGQGTAQSLGTNTVGLTGPTSITSYNLVFPGAAGNGCLSGANSLNIVTLSFVSCSGGISGLTTGFFSKAASATSIANSLCDEGITTSNVITCTDTGGITAPSFQGSSSSAAGYFQSSQGTAPSAVANAWQIFSPPSVTGSLQLILPEAAATGLWHLANSSGAETSTFSPVVGSDMTNNTVTSTQLATQYSIGSCEVIWGGTAASNVLQSGDDTIANTSCYNAKAVTETIVDILCLADAGTPTVNPTFGASGTGTTILSGALTCGAGSYASAIGSSLTISHGALATTDNIDPVMGGTLTSSHDIHLIVKYTY